MARKPHIKAEELPPIVAALREIAARLETKTPKPVGSKEYKEQEDSLHAAQVEAGRLILAAREAGVFADRDGLDSVIAQSERDTDKEAFGDGKEHLEFFRLGVCLATVESWMPERWPDHITGPAESPGKGEDYNYCRYYAANLRILADKIEGAWALAQPSGSFPGGPGKAGQSEARPLRESALEKTRCAGAQSEISTNKDGAEMQNEVRSYGAQVRTSANSPKETPAQGSSGAPPAAPLRRVRQWAETQADEIKAKAEDAEFRALYLAAAYTAQAFERAQQAAQWTRGSKPPEVAEFVNTFAELHECRSRATELLEEKDRGEVWAHWPAAPGTVYCWKADNSALAVAYAFARMIETEIYANCSDGPSLTILTHRAISPSSKLLSTPADVPVLTVWRDKAISGMAEKSLPPVSDWPRWAMHRDEQALLCKLHAEYSEAVNKARKIAIASNGVPMPETTESLPDRIARFIADAEEWMKPRGRLSFADAPYPERFRKEDEEREKTRQRAVIGGKAVAESLVGIGENARAVLTILNSLESKDWAKARKDWPAVKVELQEAAIRVRRKAGATAANPDSAADGSISGNPPGVVQISPVDDEAVLSPKQLAERFDVPYGALKKRLERLRKTNLDCFTEIADRGPKDPQFLFRVKAVRPVIDDLKAREASRKRPA